jgi:XTP/dITP diphosphohydrolase
MKLCFATNNKGKLSEIRSMLGNHMHILSLEEIGAREELPENQDTLEGNSREKASYLYNKYNFNCFADDTGLEVMALQGAPGVYSARYAGPDCDPEKNMRLLLSQLNGTDNREACFRTIITLVLNGQYHQFEGKVEGTIARSASGNKGFGYDPVFIPLGYDQTFAQLSLEEKNLISHRGQAVRKLINYLMQLPV